MKQSDIFLPACGLVGLTAIVWGKMYYDRIREIQVRKLTEKDMKNKDTAFRNALASDNFTNLAEVPILFYALTGALYSTGSVTPRMITASWTFVGLRVVHSLIHCSYNNVYHRFTVYFASTLILFGMWGSFATKLLTE